MSWASDAVKRLRPPHNEGSAWAIERAIRETIEEAARQCDEPTVTRDARAGRAVIKRRILAMLDDTP